MADKTPTPSTHANTRVGKEVWTRAALDVIAAQGVGEVKVERLAKTLGITKGSFYWHFEDRADLVAEAIELWVRLGTLDVIERLRVIEDPEARLRALFSESFGDLVDGPIDALLLGQVDDPTIGPAVRRVTTERLGFLVDAYRDLGLPADRAAARARLTYAAYIGAGHLSQAAAGTDPDPAVEAAFERELEILLTP